MENNLIKCSCISVDCVANDPVDIRCGGPEYLGFDFFVKEEETEHMLKFIAVTLESLEVPLKHLYVQGNRELSPQNIWDKKRIVEAIQKDANYLRREASCNYRRR